MPRTVSIMFYAGQVLFRSSQIGMSGECCCGGCHCTILGARPGLPCESCADSDYATSFITPRQVKVSIADVLSGTTNTTDCQYYNNNPFGQEFFSRLGLLSNPDCEIDVVGSDTGFFNADFILDPCTTSTLWECVYKCSSLNYAGGGGVNFDYFEYNAINLSYQNPLPNFWSVFARLDSYVAMYQTALEGTVCSNPIYMTGIQTPDKLLTAPGAGGLYYWLSNRTKQFSWTIDAGTRPGYYYDPASCDPECQIPYSLPRCVQPGDVWTPSTLTSTNTCKKAVDVEAATATLTVL